MGSSKFDFDRSFQIKILSLMKHDYDFLILAQDLISPDYFESSPLAWYFLKMRNYYMDYQATITDDVLRNELLKDCRRKRIKEDELCVYSQVFQGMLTPVNDNSYVKNEVVTFCKHQAIKSTVLDLPSLLEANDFNAIEATMKKAFEVGAHHTDIGEQFFLTYQERIRRRETRMNKRILPTGITQLDICLGGGLRPTQLGIWMGPPNRGKSLALAHCVKRQIIAGKYVIHYSMEMATEEVGERYDSAFSRINVRQLFNEESQLAKTMEDMGKKLGNRLIIKDYPTKQASVDTIKGHLGQCRQIGFKPDLVVIDYLDLLKPLQARTQKRDELSDITADLRGLAKTLDIPIWTATQSNRGAISLKTHTEEQVAEDLGKIAIADVVLTLNQTVEEVHEQEMRIFVAKNRNGPKYYEYPIKMNLERMCFYDPQLSP